MRRLWLQGLRVERLGHGFCVLVLVRHDSWHYGVKVYIAVGLIIPTSGITIITPIRRAGDPFSQILVHEITSFLEDLSEQLGSRLKGESTNTLMVWVV